VEFAQLLKKFTAFLQPVGSLSTFRRAGNWSLFRVKTKMKLNLNMNDSADKFARVLQHQHIVSMVCYNIFSEFHFYIHVIDIAFKKRERESE
jgi:hypothetical protein